MFLVSKIEERFTALVAIVFISASLLSVASCAASDKVRLQEALATSINDNEKQVIEDTISDWFGGIQITVAANVFSEDSSMTIERRAKLDSRGLPIEGRHDNPVYSFTLLSNGDQCLLRNDQTDELAELENVKCYVIPVRTGN